MNSFGEIFRLTTFGESHGLAIGGVIDGMQPGITVDTGFIQSRLDLRRPGTSAITTARCESDCVQLLSGVFEGKTTGTPIGFMIANSDQHSADYDELRDVFRPSHADFTYQAKYGIRDHRGGGRSSARETACRVVGGAFAQLALNSLGIQINAYTSQVGDIVLDKPYTELDLDAVYDNAVRCPDLDTAVRMEQLIRNVKADADSIGGVVSCVIRNVPAGLGEPVFDRLQSRLAAAMMSINAAKGFEYGMGFSGCCRRGSEMMDVWLQGDDGARPHTATNHSGGIQGGISNGEDIYFRVAFKPVATLPRELQTITTDGKETVLKARGRHDPCVLPRAVPVVEAMAAMTLYDFLLLQRSRIKFEV